jgi:hypothetical protein
MAQDALQRGTLQFAGSYKRTNFMDEQRSCFSFQVSAATFSATDSVKLLLLSSFTLAVQYQERCNKIFRLQGVK